MLKRARDQLNLSPKPKANRPHLSVSPFWQQYFAPEGDRTPLYFWVRTTGLWVPPVRRYQEASLFNGLVVYKASQERWQNHIKMGVACLSEQESLKGLQILPPFEKHAALSPN